MNGASKAKTAYAAGMNLHCCYAKEFNYSETWLRIELYHDDQGILRAASYARRGAYWIPFSNRICAMEKRGLLQTLDREMAA